MNKWKLINADSGEKTWLTPKWIIDALGHFDTDPCCPPNMPWRTADIMLTKTEDGTTAPWHGRVWLNPPYGREALPFLKRMASHLGGGCHLYLAEQTQRHGTNGYFQSHILFCLCVDESGSYALMEQRRSPRQHHPLSSRIPRRILSLSRRAELKEQSLT